MATVEDRELERQEINRERKYTIIKDKYQQVEKVSFRITFLMWFIVAGYFLGIRITKFNPPFFLIDGDIKNIQVLIYGALLCVQFYFVYSYYSFYIALNNFTENIIYKNRSFNDLHNDIAIGSSYVFFKKHWLLTYRIHLLSVIVFLHFILWIEIKTGYPFFIIDLALFFGIDHLIERWTIKVTKKSGKTILDQIDKDKKDE